MSAALAAVQAIVLLKHRGFNSDLPVSGPSIRGLDDEANPASSNLSSRTYWVQTHRARKTRATLRRRIRRGPEGPAGLCPVTVHILGGTSRRPGFVGIALLTPLTQRRLMQFVSPAPVSFVLIFGPQVGWRQAYVQR